MLRALSAAICVAASLALSRDGSYYGTVGSGMLGSSYGGRRSYGAYGGAGYSPYTSVGSTTGGYRSFYGGGGLYPGTWSATSYRYRRSVGEGQTAAGDTHQRVKRESELDAELRAAAYRLQQSVDLNAAAKDLPFYPDFPNNDAFIPGQPSPRADGFIPGRPKPYPRSWSYPGSGSYAPRQQLSLQETASGSGVAEQ